MTSERIQDKLAASKKRGMWMGGVVTPGYDPSSRKDEALIKLIVRAHQARKASANPANFSVQNAAAELKLSTQHFCALVRLGHLAPDIRHHHRDTRWTTVGSYRLAVSCAHQYPADRMAGVADDAWLRLASDRTEVQGPHAGARSFPAVWPSYFSVVSAKRRASDVHQRPIIHATHPPTAKLAS